MKITELMLELQKALEEHGDLEMYVNQWSSQGYYYESELFAIDIEYKTSGRSEEICILSEEEHY